MLYTEERLSGGEDEVLSRDVEVSNLGLDKCSFTYVVKTCPSASSQTNPASKEATLYLPNLCSASVLLFLPITLSNYSLSVIIFSQCVVFQNDNSVTT